MNEENKQLPNLFIDNSDWRLKSNIAPNFDHCRYMLDSEMNICYISTIDNGSKDCYLHNKYRQNKRNHLI